MIAITKVDVVIKQTDISATSIFVYFQDVKTNSLNQNKMHKLTFSLVYHISSKLIPVMMTTKEVMSISIKH